MRNGMNPNKKMNKVNLKTRHRVIIVVFIPEKETKYYREILDVFKTCLRSLQTTINDNCAITVVNNGSNQKLVEFLNIEYGKGNIDQLVHHKNNIGKMDALIGAARSSREELITITDTDILFISGWQEAVEKIFYAFPKAGSVSPIPMQTNAIFYNTSSTIKDIVKGNLKYTLEEIPENFEALNSYLRSINWKEKKDKKIKWPVVEKNNVKAILGSGHQVMTVRRYIFLKYTPTNPSLVLVGGDSEYTYGDEPTDLAGLYRLATYNNFAFHMGNSLEDWMLKKLEVNKIPKSSLNVFNHQKNFNDKPFKKMTFNFKKRFFIKLFKFFFSYRPTIEKDVLEKNNHT